MIHIIKQKKGFAVANVAKNGELLKISETVSSKASCWNNIRSEMTGCYDGIPYFIQVQDDTLKTPKVYLFKLKGRKLKTIQIPRPVYQPGKNKPTTQAEKRKKG